MSRAKTYSVTIVNGKRSTKVRLSLDLVKSKILEMFPDRAHNTDFFLSVLELGGVATIGGDGKCIQASPYKRKN